MIDKWTKQIDSAIKQLNQLKQGLNGEEIDYDDGIDNDEYDMESFSCMAAYEFLNEIQEILDDVKKGVISSHVSTLEKELFEKNIGKT